MLDSASDREVSMGCAPPGVAASDGDGSMHPDAPCEGGCAQGPELAKSRGQTTVEEVAA